MGFLKKYGVFTEFSSQMSQNGSGLRDGRTIFEQNWQLAKNLWKIRKMRHK